MKTLFSLVTSLFLTVSAVAAPPALELKHDINLSDFQGTTFLQAMIRKDTGIKANLDDDYLTKYSVTDWRQVKKALNNFDKKVVGKVLRSFEDGEQGLKSLTEALEGKTFTPNSMVGLVRSELKGGDVFAVAQLLAMASGAGTVVRIDADNYYYNYGYKSGEEADDVKSGRSFGAGPSHAANDASDVFYLNELEVYLEKEKDIRPFFTAIMKILTQCDTSGFASLSEEGQTVATDFLAIYTAESDRHIMVDLSPRSHPWENDLAEVTFIAAYGVATGKVFLGGTLQDGQMREYWAKSEISNRSGIGKTRTDRRHLERLLTEFHREKNVRVVEAIEGIVGEVGPKGNVYQAVMEYLNNYKTQADVKRNADDLTKAFVAFLAKTEAHSDEATEDILSVQ